MWLFASCTGRRVGVHGRWLGQGFNMVSLLTLSVVIAARVDKLSKTGRPVSRGEVTVLQWLAMGYATRAAPRASAWLGVRSLLHRCSTAGDQTENTSRVIRHPASTIQQLRSMRRVVVPRFSGPFRRHVHLLCIASRSERVVESVLVCPDAPSWSCHRNGGYALMIQQHGQSTNALCGFTRWAGPRWPSSVCSSSSHCSRCPRRARRARGPR